METNYEKPRSYIAENPPTYGDRDSALALLYEAYAGINRMDDDHINSRSERNSTGLMKDRCYCCLWVLLAAGFREDILQLHNYENYVNDS